MADNQSQFAPRGEDRDRSVGGLQRAPIDPVVQVSEPAEEYSPWQVPSSRMGTGKPAREVPEPAPEPTVTVPAVDVREAMFGRVVPWRFVALGAAVVLAIGGVGGFVGGWAGKSFYAQHTKVELAQVEGRPGDGSLSQIGEVAERIRPTVVSIDVSAADISAVGSGFVIDQRGYILTNNHVVSAIADRKDAKVTVNFASAGEMRQVDATLVGRDPQTDLAVIQVHNVDGLTVSQLGDSDAVRVGDTVVAMGSPQGLGGTVTSGIVSALNRPIRLKGEGTDTDGYADAIQTDASINPGNSGGPLVDVRGAVIGINTMIFSMSGGSQGLGFSIPINTAKAVAEQLIAGEEPTHPSIGVTARTAANGPLVGAELATVPAGSIAADAGLREGDVITAVGDRAVTSADELTVALWTSGAGKEAKLTVVRDGQRIEVNITPQ